MKENRDKIHLERILEATNAIGGYINGYDYERFIGDKNKSTKGTLHF